MVTTPFPDGTKQAMPDPILPSPSAEMVDIGAETLSEALVEQLATALERAESAGAPLLLRLSRAADPGKWPGAEAVRDVNRWERVLRQIERTRVPVLVLARGACSELALEILLVGDCRVATADFTVSPRSQGNPVWPSMALFRLANQIGQARTKRLVLRTAALTAAEARDLDLVEHVAPEREAQSYVETMLRRPALADFAIRRRLIQDATGQSYDEALGAHLAACDRELRGAVPQSRA